VIADLHDPVVVTATAALRGVEVRLLLPGRSNHPLVWRAGRTFYEDLLEAGVRIYEYGPGMILDDCSVSRRLARLAEGAARLLSPLMSGEQGGVGNRTVPRASSSGRWQTVITSRRATS